jgi:hypothetical protein
MTPAKFVRFCFESLPVGGKQTLKQLLGASGHKNSVFDYLKGKYLAQGRKRFDRVLSTLAARLKAVGSENLDGRNCLEFGAGYVPSEILAFWVLGSGKTVAIDYYPIAQMGLLYDAVRSSNRSVAFDVVRHDPAATERLVQLFGLSRKDMARFLNSTFTYLAPLDLTKGELSPEYDIIHSQSVLEHLPPEYADLIARNLHAGLRSQGMAIHYIDLMDHRDHSGNPLGFLALKTDYNQPRDFDARGNRLRKSEWLSFLSKAGNISVLQETRASPQQVPKQLLDEFVDRDDIDVTSIMVKFTSRG